MKKQQGKTPKSAAVWTSKTKLRIALLFFAFGFLLYANTLNHNYTLDDFSVIKDNFVTQQGLAGIPTAWKEHYRYGYWNSTASLYRPLTMTTFNLDWAMFPDNPRFSHWVNVILYGLTGASLFFALTMVFKNYNQWIPILITAIFIAHPTHVECVANIKGRDEILGFLFMTIAIITYWQYLKSKKVNWLIGTAALFLLALFSKESSITFVVILPMIAYFTRNESVSKLIKSGAILLIPAIIFLVLRYQVVGTFGVGKPDVLDNALIAAPNKLNAIASAISILGIYLYKMFLPFNMVHEMGYAQFTANGLSDWKFYVSLAIFGVLTIYAFIQIKKKDVLALGILFFLLSISLLCNVFIVIGVHYAERLLYYPLMGFCISLVFGIFKIFKIPVKKPALLKSSFEKSKLPILILGGFTILCIVLTVLRSPAWESSYTLYHTDIKKSPKSAKLNYHYGLELVKKGLDNQTIKDKEYLSMAKKRFENALSIRPSYADAYGQLGLAYYREKNKAKAMESYQKSLSLNANNAKVYSNMGIIYFEAQQLDKAEEVYRESIKIDSRFVDARRNLGSVLAMQGKFQEAITHFSEAIKYEPDNATLHFYLGQATRDGGNPKAAEQHFQRAYQLDPSLKK